MAGMIVQHNLNAINANNKLNINVLGTKKATEKLSSGFRINRAADDAAGLAISEKMRAQIRGLGQAIRNANDGISLIQTAEGALDETHDMLKRLEELAVQAGNDTYGDEERKYMQKEIDDIKSEIDRIAKATDFNGIKLLDGSLAGGTGATNDKGARYGVYLSNIAGTPSTGSLGGSNLSLEGTVITTNVNDVTVKFVDGATIGGENAEYSTDGKTLTINLKQGQSYTQSTLNEILAKAAQYKGDEQNYVPANVSISLKNGVFTFDADATFTTSSSKIAVSDTAAKNLSQFLIGGTGITDKYADTIQLISNVYGYDVRKISIVTDADKGEEKVDKDVVGGEAQGVKNGQFTLHLSTGVEYTAKDIEKILAKAGLDYTVELSSAGSPDGDVTFYANTKITAQAATATTAQISSAAVTSMISAITGRLQAIIDLVATTAAGGLTGTDINAAISTALATLSTALVGTYGTDAINSGGSFSADEIDAIKAAITKAINDKFATFTTSAGDVTNGTVGFTTLQNQLIAAAASTDFTSLINAAVARAKAVTGTTAAQVTGVFFDTTDDDNFNPDAIAAKAATNGLTLTLDKGAGVGADKLVSSGTGLTFQIGTNNAVEQRVTLSIGNMDSNSIGIATFDVSTSAAARESLDRVKGAITNVSAQRGSLGALQNRLEHTVNSLTVSTENLTAAEAQIRDTDMATEMVNYTKFSILQQAAQAMLAQANQAPQAVLQLLQ